MLFKNSLDRFQLIIRVDPWTERAAAVFYFCSPNLINSNLVQLLVVSFRSQVRLALGLGMVVVLEKIKERVCLVSQVLSSRIRWIMWIELLWLWWFH